MTVKGSCKHCVCQLFPDSQHPGKLSAKHYYVIIKLFEIVMYWIVTDISVKLVFIDIQTEVQV